MKGKTTLMKADGSIIVEQHSKALTLAYLQEAVGGFIEEVPYFTVYKGERCVAFYNEKGKGMTGSKFKIGDRVAKIGGDYTLIGTVRAVYLTNKRRVRYVVEPDMYGLQLIYSAKVLTAVSKNDEAAITGADNATNATENSGVVLQESPPVVTSASVAKTRLANGPRKGRKAVPGKPRKAARGRRKAARG